MKKLFALSALAAFFFGTVQAQTPEAKPKPSPAAKVSETLTSGAVITIDYSQPALKGRVMGKDVEPMDGKVWRAGANDATVFEVSKDVKINGQTLPAGKYGFFTLVQNGQWTFIFNKVSKQWGAFSYAQDQDALRVPAKAGKTAASVERLTYTISKAGEVALSWGDVKVGVTVQ